MCVKIKNKENKTEDQKQSLNIKLYDVITEDKLNKIKEIWKNETPKTINKIAAWIGDAVIEEKNKRKVMPLIEEIAVEMLNYSELEKEAKILLMMRLMDDKKVIKFAVDELKNMVEEYERTDKEPKYLENILFIIDKYSKEDYSAIFYLERLYNTASKDKKNNTIDYIRRVYLKVYELYSKKELW